MPGQMYRITHDDWRSGSWGAYGAAKGPQNGRHYDSVNMQIYSNGLLGVRPWMRAHTHLGSNNDRRYQEFRGAFSFTKLDGDLDSTRNRQLILWWAREVASGWSGSVWNVEYDETGQRASALLTAYSPLHERPWPRFYELATKYYGFQNAIDLTASSGAMGGQIKIRAYDGSLTPDTEVLGATGDIGTEFFHLFPHKARFWAYDPISTGNPRYRIYWSATPETDVSNWDNWNAVDFVGVGAHSTMDVVGAWPLLNGMLIATVNNEWFMYTHNSEPGSGTLRNIGRFPVPRSMVSAANIGSSIMFILLPNEGIFIGSAQGVIDDELQMLHPLGDAPYSPSIVVYPKRGITALKHNAVILPFYMSTSSYNQLAPTGEQAFELIHGVWFRSQFWNVGTDISANWINAPTEHIMDWFQLGEQVIGCVARLNDIAIVTPGTHENWVVFTRDVCLDRPSGNSDIWSDKLEDKRWAGPEPGAGAHTKTQSSAGLIRLPLHTTQDSLHHRPVKIIVDFQYWLSGTEWVTPRFILWVMQENERLEVTTTNVADLANLTPSGWTATTNAGRRRRETFVLDLLPYGSVSQLIITDIQSVAFDKITIEYEPVDTPLTSRL